MRSDDGEVGSSRSNSSFDEGGSPMAVTPSGGWHFAGSPVGHAIQLVADMRTVRHDPC